MQLYTPTHNSRLWERHPCDLDAVVSLYRAREQMTLNGKIWNISREGMKLLVDRPIPPLSVVRVRVESAPHLEAQSMLALVVYAQTDADGSCLMGCRMVRILSEQDLKTLLQAN